MAKNDTAQTRDPDVKRDFETGTVNPGPGMAPPHSANDIPAGSMTGAEEASEQKESRSDAKNQQPKPGDYCGCG
jgi:hypothetical protein